MCLKGQSAKAQRLVQYNLYNYPYGENIYSVFLFVAEIP